MNRFRSNPVSRLRLAGALSLALLPLASLADGVAGTPAPSEAPAAAGPDWLPGALPEPLQHEGPLDLFWWQWLALPLFVLAAIGLGRLLGRGTGRLLARLARNTEAGWDDELVPIVSPGLGLLWAVGVVAVLLPWIELPAPVGRAGRSLLAALATLAVFWTLWRSVDVVARLLSLRPWASESPSARSILSLGRNLAKTAVVLGGVLSLVASFGYPVTTVVAGLGIGGVALAFGAQKTVENLFGSIAIAVDQPFRVGDFVRAEGFQGHVERVGMRSTQIRTLDRSIVSIPNGKLADMQTEDMAARDRIRLAASLGLVYGTTEAQMRQVLAGIERLLREHPRVWPEAVVVRFAGFGASSLDIEVQCWFLTTDFDEFRDFRQETLLGIMRIVAEAGSGFAFPTQTLHLVKENAAS